MGDSSSVRLAVGETVFLLHHPPPSVGVSIAIERGRQQNDSLADGAGTIHELRVYNRSLTEPEILAVSAEMGRTWGVSAADGSCAARPKPTHNCAALEAAHGLPAAALAK